MKRICYLLTIVMVAMTLEGVTPKANAEPAQAELLKVSSIFGDHMVLQRKKPVPVWGWASPGAKVTVEFTGQEHSATTGKDGRWNVRLTSLTAGAEGQTIKITEGNSTLEIKDVLVGEVWVCSGQSNMG